MNALTPGNWRVGNGGTVVSDCPNQHPEDKHRAGDHDYYGGELICEGIMNPGDRELLANSKRLFECCKKLMGAKVADAIAAARELPNILEAIEGIDASFTVVSE